jgi:hypothetical protein
MPLLRGEVISTINSDGHADGTLGASDADPTTNIQGSGCIRAD